MGIEGIDQARKMQRALVYYILFHVAFMLRKKAITMKLKGPNIPTNVQDPMSVQHRLRVCS